MANISLTLTVANYPRVMPLVTGDVKARRDRSEIDPWQAYDIGVVGRVVTAEEYFAEFLES